MSETDSRDLVQAANETTRHAYKRLKIGRIVQSLLHGPSKVVGVVLTPSKAATDRYSHQIRPIFAPDDSEVILQTHRYLARPVDVAILDEAILLLRTPVDEEFDYPLAHRRKIMATGDVLAIAKILRALHQIKSRTGLQEDDYRQTLDYLAKTFAGRAVVTRRPPITTSEERNRYLVRAKDVVEAMLTGRVWLEGPVDKLSLGHFYHFNPLPIKATHVRLSTKVSMALAPKPALRAPKPSQTPLRQTLIRELATFVYRKGPATSLT